MPFLTVHLILDKVKTFWNDPSMVRVLVFQHVHTLCLEVVVIDFDLHKEYPRMYLSVSKLLTKIDVEMMDAFYNSMFTAQSSNEMDFVDTNELLAQSERDFMAEYVFSRLHIFMDTKEMKKRVCLQPRAQDALILTQNNVTKLDTKCDKPYYLVPFELKETVY